MKLRLLLCAALALAACKKSPSVSDGGAAAFGPSTAWLEGRVPEDRGEPTDGGTLVIRSMAEPLGFNYLDEDFREAWTSRICRNTVFESLLEIDSRDYSLKPQLALTYETSEDHLTHTFHLRRNVKFHDGTRMTSADVVAVFDAVMNPKLPTAGVRADFVDLESWKATDDATVILKWKKASPFALRQVAKLPIYPASTLSGDWKDSKLIASPVGTGPFKFASWEKGSKLTLERYPEYWGPKAHLEKVVFRFVDDHTVAAGLWEKGEFDVMTSVQPVLWRSLESKDPKNAWAQNGWFRIRAPENSYSYIGWNQAVPALADVRVRRALAMLYPSELIAKNVDLNLEVPTTCPFWIESKKCDPTVTPIQFDPKKARAELEAAGFTDSDKDGVLDKDGKKLSLRFLLPTTSVRLGKLVPLLQESMAQAGVELVPEKLDAATIGEKMTKRDFEVVSKVWTEFDAEQDLFQIFHSSQIGNDGSNFVGFKNAEVDQLLEQIRAELDVRKRRELERQLHRKIYSEQPYLFMTARQTLDAAKTRVHGLRPSLVWYDLKRVWVDP